MGIEGIRISGLGAKAQAERLETVARNLANLFTPAWRRERTVFRSRLAGALGAGLPAAERLRETGEPGPFETTGRPLDFALRSRGYFTVRDLASGDVLYTRAGDFRIDGEGRLVTADGRAQVLAEGGAGMALDPRLPPDVRMSPDGTLFQGAVELGRPGVADFQDPGALRPRGSRLLEAPEGVGPREPVERRLEQGVREASSVDPVVEMAELIRAVRAVESNLQMVRFQDAVLGRTVNEYARLPR